MKRYYLDAGIFLTPMLKNLDPATVRACENWIKKVAAAEIIAVTSYLTWDEVAWVAGRAVKGAPFDRNRARDAAAALLGIPNLQFVPVDETIINEAGNLLDSLAPRDSIHASTAILHAAGNLVTADSDFFSSRSRAAGLVIHPVRVVH